MRYDLANWGAGVLACLQIVYRKISVILISMMIVGCSAAVKQTDLRIWYEAPAEEWMSEALPIGNGKMGAMVFGAIDEEHIQFNEESLWEGGRGLWPQYRGGNRPEAGHALPKIRELLAKGQLEAAHEMASEEMVGDWLGEERQPDGSTFYNGFGAYQPFGDLYIQVPTDSDITDYQRELDLETGVARVQYRAGSIHHNRLYFANYPSEVLVFHFENDAAEGVTYGIRLESS